MTSVWVWVAVLLFVVAFVGLVCMVLDHMVNGGE